MKNYWKSSGDYMGIDKLGDKGLESDDYRKVLSVKEHGRSYYLLNPCEYRVRCYRIDGGVITDGMRCDYGILTDFSNCSNAASTEIKLGNFTKKQCRFYLVELKGKDLSHAAEQLNDTITKLEHSIAACVIEARIILSRVSHPDLPVTSVIQLERRLARLGGRLKKASNMLEETLLV